MGDSRKKMSMLSHTPPVFSVGSMDPLMKRARSGSISKRLRNAAEMCEENLLDKEDQGALKDIIIRDDPRLQRAMQRIEAGDREVLKEMLADGTIASARKASLDLMGDFGDLNLDFLNVGDEDVGGSPSASPRDNFMDADDQFEFTFDDGIGLGPSGLDDLASTSPPLNFSHGSLSAKSNPRAIRQPSSSSSREDASQMRPVPIKVRDKRAESFGQPLPDLFDFNLFDDVNAPNVSYSPMSHSPSRSLGSLGTGVGSHRPLHRDSIAHLDDLLLPPHGSFSSTGASFDGSDNAISAPIGIPRSRDSTLSKSSLKSAMRQSSGTANFLNQQQNAQPHHQMQQTQQNPQNKMKRGIASKPKTKPVVPPTTSLNSSTVGRPPKAPVSAPPPVRQPITQPTPVPAANGGAGTPAASAPVSIPVSVPGGGMRQPVPSSALKTKSDSQLVPNEPQPPSGASTVQALDMSSTNMQTGYIGGYSPDSRRRRIEKFLQKRHNRIWMKRVKYDVRKNFADSRLRVKGRFVKKEDEEVLRELIIMTM